MLDNLRDAIESGCIQPAPGTNPHDVVDEYSALGTPELYNELAGHISPEWRAVRLQVGSIPAPIQRAGPRKISP